MQTKINSQELPEQYMSWTDMWGSIEEQALLSEFISIEVASTVDISSHKKRKEITPCSKSVQYEVEYIDAMARRECLINNYEAEHNYIQQKKNLGLRELDSKTYDFSGEYEDEDTIPIQLVINEINMRLEKLRSDDCTLELIEQLNY